MDSAEIAIPLTEMKKGQQGIITEIQGGLNMQEKLQNMGIIEGKKIKVISVQALRGPITIGINHTQVALGHGISERIILKPQ